MRKLAAASAAENGSTAMVQLIARVLGVGIETADMLVSEVFSRRWRDHKAIARYAGLTGSPDESGKRRRERGLARAGSARVRCSMIQFAWRFLRFQKNSALARWFAARTTDRRASTRKTMIVALARKLLIALWRLATRGEVPWTPVQVSDILRQDGRALLFPKAILKQSFEADALMREAIRIKRERRRAQQR